MSSYLELKAIILPIPSFFTFLVTLMLCAVTISTNAAVSGPGKSKDASIRREKNRWILASSAVEKVLEFHNGRLTIVSYKDRFSGHEFIPSGERIDVLWPGMYGTEMDQAWVLLEDKSTLLPEGQLQLALSFGSNNIKVTLHYVLYPGSSVIREWADINNGGTSHITLKNIAFQTNCLKLCSSFETLDLNWMTGARNEPGSWVLKTEKLVPGKIRAFDSYDPFPGTGSRATGGDGVNAMITCNDEQVWPTAGWRFCKPDADIHEPFDFTVDVKAGDKLRFIVNRYGNFGFDTTEFDPEITYHDGETHTASKEFTGRQGENNWQYGYLKEGAWHNLDYYPDVLTWKITPDNSTHTPFVMDRLQHPDTDKDVVRQWTAPKEGQVHVTGYVSNVGNYGLGTGSNTSPKMGSESYAPWYTLYDTNTHHGIIIGWDYMGRWASSFKSNSNGVVETNLRLAGFSCALPPGKTITTPKSFTALYRDDLDNAGNELLDWQYRYMWGYTRKGWFPAIPMLGYWYKGTGWGEPGVSWVGGCRDIQSQYTKIFRMADTMRYVGADIYHRDWGWWDRAGDWNGPDFGDSGKYLKKYGIKQLIYAFLYTVDLKSKVAKQHPDWVIDQTLDMSKPEVVAFIKGQLDDFHKRWGDFAWRNDSTPTAPRGNDDTGLLGQDQGFRDIIQSFLDKYPGSSFQSVNGGGNEAGYDYVRLSNMIQFSDGVIGPLRNYFASLLFPPDKLEDNGDQWNPDQFDRGRWHSLLSMAMMTTGDTWDKVKMEGIREQFDIYHYLESKGVVGRWVKVYRPLIDGDDPTMYIQRLSQDRKRGMIIPARSASNKVTIVPKGLLPEENYLVTFHEAAVEKTILGKELMKSGITIEKMNPGELIYLNLPMHPGSKRDSEAPTAPARLSVKSGVNMGFPGVELSWSPATDNNWISYYEIIRDGLVIDKVSKGTFYFDHSAGADPAGKYTVVTVDGAENRSKSVTSAVARGERSVVFNDTDPALHYTGAWRHENGLQPAHMETITWSEEKGATVEMEFTGGKLLLFSKLGADYGRALISIDGGANETIDTYCADDVWGVCVYSKKLSKNGTHNVRITIAGEHNPLSKGNRVIIDGLRAEP